MSSVNENAGKKTLDMGIELVDVRIKKVELPPEVSNSVFLRMIKERATGGLVSGRASSSTQSGRSGQ